MNRLKEFFKNKQNRKKLISIMLLTLFVIGFTLAYVAPIVDEITRTNIYVEGSQGDELEFIQGDDLVFTPNMENLPENGENYTESTSAYAKAIANDETNTYTANYTVTFGVETNEYIYTTEDSTPELILTIQKPDETYVTSISGLTYYESTSGLSGFDVTTFTGEVTVALDYEITTESEITDEWIFTITMANLETNQALNSMKTFVGTVTLGV